LKRGGFIYTLFNKDLINAYIKEPQSHYATPVNQIMGEQHVIKILCLKKKTQAILIT
jgi:hypothetical protein